MPRSTAATTDPIAILKADHKVVKRLFKDFEQTTNARSKSRIVRDTLLELDAHAGIEEEIFYPAFQAEVDDEEKQQITLEAEEEHHLVHILIGELREMNTSDPRLDAKFMVLAENVLHHIKEEESEMLPRARKLGKARLSELGEQMARRRAELQRQFKGEATPVRQAS